MSDAISFNATTPRFSLPNLFPGQSQKEFFVNEALGILDGLLHLSVEGEASDPPPSPAINECWIIDANATGEWLGEEGKLALFGEGGWVTISPSLGMLAFDKSVGQFKRFDGSWQQASTPNNPQGGTTVDAEARAAIDQIIAALRVFGVFSST